MVLVLSDPNCCDLHCSKPLICGIVAQVSQNCPGCCAVLCCVHSALCALLLYRQYCAALAALPSLQSVCQVSVLCLSPLSSNLHSCTCDIELMRVRPLAWL
eukprot:TRINITY_DN8882_c0_g3_i1.p1 TRINITY_DN8882_c0_g3~~TRINITY_DN8882_c0_g3_i1.p1  ORF type:complete len:101 (+),score=9.47 TRINITY_DN8882_c0_g3_i1:548-850(+)